MIESEWAKKIQDDCYVQHSSYEGYSDFDMFLCTGIISEIRAEARAEAADRAWPLLKQEYERRHEDSECGGDEISEGLDILNARLRAAITQEGGINVLL
jgi:hypothetical protein